MPETAMDEQGQLVAREHQVGGSREISPMEPKSQPERVRNPPNPHLG